MRWKNTRQRKEEQYTDAGEEMSHNTTNNHEAEKQDNSEGLYTLCCVIFTFCVKILFFKMFLLVKSAHDESK